MNSVLISTVSKTDRADTPNFSLSCPPSVAAAVQDLMTLGFSPLPVAPAYPASEYPSRKDPSKPRFNGKNPSYIGSNGKPYEVRNWQQYADRLPAEAELQKWLNHPDIRIGHVAVSVDGKRRVLDVDRKDFSSDSHFERETNSLVSMATHLERTPGGGYHALVEFTAEDPVKALGKAQANIGLGDVDHAGELPQFVVSYPTPGYELIKSGPPLKVRSLEDIGVRFTARATTAPKTADSNPPKLQAVAPSNVVTMPGTVPLEKLIYSEYQTILAGQCEDDRSDALNKFAWECFGWENAAESIGVPITSAEALIQQAAAALGIDDKWERVIQGINRTAATPIQQKKSGRKVVTARLRKLAVKASQSGKKEKELQRLNKLELHDFLESKFKIVLDTWKGEILIDGETIDIENLHVRFAVEYGIDVGKESVMDTITYIAAQNEKDDVLDYLRSLEDATPLPAELWDRLAHFVLGSSDSFDSTLLQRMLISAVARAYEPGCKVDECVVFQGPQGLGKSSFFEALAGRDFFTDELGDFAGNGKKDACQKLRTNWFAEIAELDKLTSKKDAGELKSFITTKVDDYRPAYARVNKKFKRRNIFVATVNPPQFLNDATGNRRYPVIRVTRPIDVQKVSEYRNQIWAAAVQAYKKGERWWYSLEETAQINKRAESYEFEDPWELEILNYIEDKDFTSTRSVLEFALKMEPGKAGNRESARVCKILAKAGWWSGKRRRVDGQLVSPWYPPRTPCQEELESAESVEQIQEIEVRYGSKDIGQAERQMEPDKREKLEELRHHLPAEKLADEVKEFIDAAAHGPEVLEAVVNTYRVANPHPATKRQIFNALPKSIQIDVKRVAGSTTEEKKDVINHE